MFVRICPSALMNEPVPYALAVRIRNTAAAAAFTAGGAESTSWKALNSATSAADGDWLEQPAAPSVARVRSAAVRRARCGRA